MDGELRKGSIGFSTREVLYVGEMWYRNVYNDKKGRWFPLSKQVSAFRTPQQIIFGSGAVKQVGDIARRLGERVMVISGARSARASGALQTVADSLTEAGLTVTLFERVGNEPTVQLVNEAIQEARRRQCNVFVGLGGGSPIDTAKCVAGLFHSSAEVQDHFYDKEPLPEQCMPWIAIPTTAGAGAEVTPNAVLTDEEANIKKSVRSWQWLAQAAIVDPNLTITCSPKVTAYSGMDALTQAIESYTSVGATPLTEGISYEATLRIGRNIQRAVQHGDDAAARTEVAWGATMAGVALANARLGAVHGFAHPVGTSLQIPHGLACAVMLPWVIQYNTDVVANKYSLLAKGLGLASSDSSDVEGAQALLQFVMNLNEQFGIPANLRTLGLRREVISDIVKQTMPSGSLASNPKTMSEADVEQMLIRNLEQ